MLTRTGRGLRKLAYLGYMDFERMDADDARVRARMTPEQLRRHDSAKRSQTVFGTAGAALGSAAGAILAGKGRRGGGAAAGAMGGLILGAAPGSIERNLVEIDAHRGGR